MPSSALVHHLPRRIRQLALEQPRKIAIKNELNEEITYKQFHEAAKLVSMGLNQRKTGDSVAILAKDPIQMAIGIFGTWYSNRTAVPLRKLT